MMKMRITSRPGIGNPARPILTTDRRPHSVACGLFFFLHLCKCMRLLQMEYGFKKKRFILVFVLTQTLGFTCESAKMWSFVQSSTLFL